MMIKLTKAPNGVLLKIRVSPGKKSFKVKGFDSWANSLLLAAKSPAREGKANQEIEKRLEGLFGKKAKIVKGFKSREKIALINSSEKEALKALKKLVA